MNVYFWPPEAPRLETIDAFVKAFGSRDYQPTDSAELQTGFELIALYVQNGIPTHAARQLSSGKWTSKLGESEDIEHELAGLESNVYGVATVFFRRPVPPI